MEQSKRPLSTHRRDLLTTAYAAFNRRDIDGVVALMTPGVEWPNGFEGGYVHGPEQVREYWTRQWTTLNPRVQPVQMDEDSEGRAVVRVHQVVCDLSGAILVDRLVEHIYSFEGELIARMDIREIGEPDLPEGVSDGN